MNHGLKATSIDYYYGPSYRSADDIQAHSAFIVIEDCEIWQTQTQLPLFLP